MSINAISTAYRPSSTLLPRTAALATSPPSGSSLRSAGGLSGVLQGQSSFGALLGDLGTAVNQVSGAVQFFEQAGQMQPGNALATGAQYGAALGSWFGPVGSLVGGVIGGVGGLLKSIFGRKDKKKEERKAVRKFLAEQTPLGPNLEFQGYVGQGQLGTISLHGKSHKVDNSQGVLAQATGMTNLLATLLAGKNERLTQEVSAMFLNAISGARTFSEALYSVRALATGMGLTPDKIAQNIIGMYQQGALSETQVREHLAYLDILAGNAPGPADGPVAAATMSNASAAAAPEPQLVLKDQPDLNAALAAGA